MIYRAKQDQRMGVLYLLSSLEMCLLSRADDKLLISVYAMAAEIYVDKPFLSFHFRKKMRSVGETTNSEDARAQMEAHHWWKFLKSPGSITWQQIIDACAKNKIAAFKIPNIEAGDLSRSITLIAANFG
jgi:hypothetical protein